MTDMPTPRVIDLSHHNIVPVDFDAAQSAGIVGVIHKLTEGESYIDDKVQARHYLASQTSPPLAWGLYHFLRPAADITVQAKFFVNVAYDLGVIDNATALIADHEDQSVSGEELKTFLDVVEDITDRSPIVYSGHVLKEQLAGSGYRPVRRLWLCQYCPPPPELPEGIDDYWLWQFTDSGVVGDLGPIDLNALPDGIDVEEFLAGWSGFHGTNPAPPIDDTPPTLTISSNRPVRIHVGPNVEIA